MALQRHNLSVCGTYIKYTQDVFMNQERQCDFFKKTNPYFNLVSIP